MFPGAAPSAPPLGAFFSAVRVLRDKFDDVFVDTDVSNVFESVRWFSGILGPESTFNRPRLELWWNDNYLALSLILFSPVLAFLLQTTVSNVTTATGHFRDDLGGP